MARSICRCGAEREQRGLELVRSFRCPSCGSEESLKEPVTRSGAGGPQATPPAGTTPPPSQTAEPARARHGGPAPSEDVATAVHFRAISETGPVCVVTPGGGSTSVPTLASGSRLGGYTIRAAIGSGGMGTVYLAHDDALDRDVAVKVISPSLCMSALFVDRFRREARLAASLAHGNITTIFGIGEDRGVHFYAMELVRGKNLGELCAARGHLPPKEAASLMVQAAQGLREAASRRIIHRDVKPSNLLLSESGTLKITDFGLAKAFLRAVEDTTTTGVVMGTPLYMSPEQGAGRSVDHRSDIYSLGVTLYQLAVGRPPFTAETPLALMVKHLQDDPDLPVDGPVPAPLSAILRKMLAKDPDRRYASYDALLADLHAFLEGRPVAALREVPADDGVLVLRRRAPGSSSGSGGASSNMARSRLSVARASLKTHRPDRALSILRELVREEGAPEVRCEAALLLAESCEKEGDLRGAREMLEVVARDSRDPVESAYASLKLAQHASRDAIARDRATLAVLERLAAAPPAGVPPEAIASRARTLKARIDAATKALERERVVLVDGD